MATDPFLTKKSVVGLAERVLLTPPPEVIDFSFYNDKISYNQSMDTWYANAPEGGIALAICTSGGYLLQVEEKFYCILQKGTSPFVYGFGAARDDELTSTARVSFTVNMSTRAVIR